MIREKILEILSTIDDVEDDFESVNGLFSKGYLDSFSVLVLIDRLEKTFHIKVEYSENFFKQLESVDLIESYVKSKLVSRVR